MLLSGALLHCILVYFWIALDKNEQKVKTRQSLDEVYELFD